MSIELMVVILLGTIVLGVLAMVGLFVLGLYLGWFSIGPAKSADRAEFRFTLDGDRIEADKNSGPKNVQDVEAK